MAGLLGQLRMRKKAEWSQPVIKRDQHHAFASQRLAVVVRAGSGALRVCAAVNPEHHRQLRPCALCDPSRRSSSRQSSLILGESGRSVATLFGTRLGAGRCTHTFPNASALRTPCQCAAGCGCFQRKSPTGGAANGMPLKARTPEASVTPDISPSVGLDWIRDRGLRFRRGNGG